MSQMPSSLSLKEEGNRLFSMGKYDEAVKCYTKGIQLNQQIPQLYTNRALCHLKLGQWAQAQMDCRSALEQDHTLVKGHFFCGQALLEQGVCDEAIKSLQRAYELAREQKLSFGDDIASVLRRAKKRKFLIQEEKRIKEEVALQEYIHDLMRQDLERRLTVARDTAEEGNLSQDDVRPSIDSITQEHEQRLGELDSLFAEVDDRRKRRDVPDYLCGKISFELMRDPVITPSGITYDRKDIEEHLQRVGHFDPVTRSELTQEQLIPNLAMKEVVHTFLAHNPWAEDGY